MRWDDEANKVAPSMDRKVLSINPDTGIPAYVNMGEMLEFISSNVQKGDPGFDAYEVWVMQPGNEGKTIEDYFIFLQTPAYEAGLTAVDAKNIAVQKAQEAEQSATESFQSKQASQQAEINSKSAESGSIEAANLSIAAKNASEGARDISVQAAGVSTTKAQEASISAQNAATSEQKAANSELAAKASEDAAKESETKSADSELAAGQAKTDSEAAQGLAEAARDAAASSRTAAETAENNAELAQAAAELAAQTSTTKAAEAAASAAAFPAVFPLIGYKSRVDADLGNIFDLNKLTELYIKNLQLLPNTVFLWSGVSGMKTRTSGSNQFASKLYNMANKVQQFGSELVTNGTFTTDTSGWTASGGATLSVDSSRLKILSPVAGYGGARQAITTVIGKTYHFAYSFILDTVTNSNAKVRITTDIAGDVRLYDSETLTASKTITISFVATTTTTYIQLINFNGISGGIGFFDNISVKQMDWIEGTNDAIQTTEANQPYVGGVIAPNEVRKIKILEDNKSLVVNSIVDAFNGASITFVLNSTLQNTSTSAVSGQINGGSLGIYWMVNGHIWFNHPQVGTIQFDNVLRGDTRNKVITLVFTKTSAILVIDGRYYTQTNAIVYQPFVGTVTSIGSVSGDSTIAGCFYHFQIFNRALSASEIQAQHEYLRLQIPEIEGIAIGNQYWTTSNYEGVVAGDGSVIPEVQYDKSDGTGTNNSPEKIINGDFEIGSTGWAGVNGTISIVTGNGFTGNALRIDATTAFAQVRPNNFETIAGKVYKVVVKYRSNKALSVRLSNSDTITQIGAINTSDALTLNAYVRASVSGTMNFIYLISGGVAGDWFEIDEASCKEAAWVDSTAVYDYVYAQTSGTTAQKELAALKAAAMWCYQNNDVNNGAIYGKLYNWYAAKLISLYPPQGWRVPTSSDFTQLVNYLGGASVAGGKMKALYGGFNNSFSTNESGFSAIPSGRRTINGEFAVLGEYWYAKPVDISNGYINMAANHTVSTLTTDALFNPPVGTSLRLLRNSPVGPNERMETSGIFDTNIASTPKQVPISFGYTVDCIRITNLQPAGGTNLTNVEAKLHNAAGTAIATLITGKTVNVASTMVYNISAEHAAMLQDGTVRVTATGNLAPGMIIEVVLKKATF